MNEVLDAPFDRLHPTKRNRPAARGLVNIPAAYVQWLLMMVAGIAIGLTISRMFALVALILWIMGCLYNFPPSAPKTCPTSTSSPSPSTILSACCSAGTPSPASSSHPYRCSSPTGCSAATSWASSASASSPRSATAPSQAPTAHPSSVTRPSRCSYR
ncbi:UbiA family prenyltransferase [Tunturiibacter empetritectus]|uniref:UbiA family prenyltransferase n=1 Tax=Tunturiibacter empetritectus TaxID=3069691 RepID=UPI003D9B042C